MGPVYVSDNAKHIVSEPRSFTMQCELVHAGLAAVAEAETWGPPNAFINAGVFFAGVCKPLSTTLLMGMTAIMRHRSRMQRH